MAQNKKKHKRLAAHNNTSSEKYNLAYKPEPDGSASVDFVLAKTIPSEKLDFQLPTTIYDSGIVKQIHKEFATTGLTANNVDRYLAKLSSAKTQLERQFDYWLSCCKDAVAPMNIYGKDKDSVIVDTLDFSEYVKSEDLTLQAFLAIQENPDVTSLWSTREYVDIKISDAVFYRVYRIGYDGTHVGVQYGIYEYVKFAISENEIITVPTNQILCYMDVVHIRNNTIAIDPNSEEHQLDKLAHDTANILSQHVTDPDSYYAIRIGILGRNCFLSMMAHLVKNHAHIPKQQYRDMLSYLETIGKTLYRHALIPNEVAIPHIETTAATVISAIIVANSYLKQNKLSKPISNKVEHQTEIILQNKPSRKTRILGKNIAITSDNRPQAPAQDRIIKYHTPEWTRKSHLRHLKNGKIVEIHATKVARRCVDMSHIKTNLPEQATDYVVKPNTAIEKHIDTNQNT